MRSGRLLIALIIGVSLTTGGCSRSGDRSSVTPSDTRPSATSSQPFDPDGPVSGLAVVETPLATGSGILLEGELLVTTAHVVWPHRRVDVRLSDGSTVPDAEVVAVDWMADLALVDVAGPDTPTPTLPIGDSASPGEQVSLVGFTSAEPGPVVVETTVSASRTWEATSLEYLETGGPIQGGHSGGALIDRDGSVVGIIVIELPDGDVLSLSGSDLAERIDAMIARTDPNGIGGRWLDDLELDGDPSPSVHALDESTWVVRPDPDTEVVLTTTGDVLSGSVVGPDGFLEATLVDGEMRFVSEIGGPHFAAIVPGASSGSVLDLVGNLSLTRLTDPDHGLVVTRGQTLFANVDRPGDLDWFLIDLAEGERVEVEASSPNADLALVVGPVDSIGGPSSTGSSDGAGGVLGADPALAFTPESTGTHVIVVFDETQLGPGGYALSVGG